VDDCSDARDLERFQALEETVEAILQSGPPVYCPHSPTPRQQEFLNLRCGEVLFGGACGGGKSDALLMAALQYVEVPGYAAIIFRETFTDLALADGLIPRSHEWLSGSGARYDPQTHTWSFPSGATVGFGYMDNENAHFRYQGAAYQFIGWDELTQHRENQYLYMFSRLRALAGSEVPLRVRGATNPGGIGHRWVERRFIDEETRQPGAVFVPAKLADNPHLRNDYLDSLGYLDPVTKARYLEGDWSVMEDDIWVYPFRRKLHVAPAPSGEAGYYVRRAAGVDPGKRDPYAVVILGEDPSGRWWALEEFYKTGGTAQTFMNEFLSLQARWACSTWWVDRRRPSDVLDLLNGGLPACANIDVHGETQRETIRPMVGVVYNLLARGLLMVTPGCVQTVREFEEYRYRDAQVKNAGEVPEDQNNHLMDALRYALCSEIEAGQMDPVYRGQRERPVGWKPERDLRKLLGTPEDAWKRLDREMDHRQEEERREGKGWGPVR